MEGDFEPGWTIVNSRIVGRLIRVTLPFDPLNGDDPGPTVPQLESTINLIRWLDQEYGVDMVVGHSDINPDTQCPGQNLKPFIPLFNKIAQER